MLGIGGLKRITLLCVFSEPSVRGSHGVSVQLVHSEHFLRNGHRVDVPTAREFRRRLYDVLEQFVCGRGVLYTLHVSAFR